MQQERQRRRLRATILVPAALCAAALQARAAGGHHAVEDAALLEPGQCQIEAWADRERGGDRTLLHVGPACRVGPFEIGVNVDRHRLAGAPSTTAFGPQLKWAHPLGEKLGVGVALAATWQDRTPRFVGGTLIVPLTWQASESFLVHLNAGRDFKRGQPDSHRAGAAIEWTPTEALSFVAERFRESSTNLWRAGVRWTFSPALSVDVARAAGLHGSVPAWWTLGVNWVFER